MKFFKYLLIWIVVVMVLAFVAGYVYVRVQGKTLFEQQLFKFFGQPATIQNVRYLVPAGIRFHKVEIPDVLEAEDVFLHLRLPFMLDKHFIIARLELVNPVFHLVRPGKKQIDFGGSYLKKQEEQFHHEKNGGKKIKGVLIDFISIKNGRFDILDLAVKDPVKYAVAKINGKAMKVAYPLLDQNIKLDIEGKILNAGEEAWLKNSLFSLSGWINWPVRAMNVVLKFDTVDGIHGDATLKGEKNIVQVKGRMDIGAVEKKEADKVKNIPGKIFPNAIFGALQATHSKLGMNFSFETKMDEFQLKMIDFEGNLNFPQDKKGLEALNPAVLFDSGKGNPGQN